jgi:hypothetical protein
MRNVKFNELLKEIQQMHDKKNTDYATKEDPLANIMGCVRLHLPPLAGVTIRMQDKWERIENFFRNKKLLNEPVRDAYLDNAIYSMMAVLIIDREKEKMDAVQELGRRAIKHDKPDASPTFAGDGCDPDGNCTPEEWTEGSPQYGKPSGPKIQTEAEILGPRFANSQVHTGHNTGDK